MKQKGPYQELEVFHGQSLGVLAQGHFADAADLIRGDCNAHQRLHLIGDFINGYQAIMILVKKGESLKPDKCFDYVL